jgi:hypothetical protein
MIYYEIIKAYGWAIPEEEYDQFIANIEDYLLDDQKQQFIRSMVHSNDRMNQDAKSGQ